MSYRQFLILRSRCEAVNNVAGIFAKRSRAMVCFRVLRYNNPLEISQEGEW